MILGMSTSAFTQLHVVISLVAIGTGLIVLYGMFGSNRLAGWTAIFLATTVLTSVTGFLFPREQILPSHIVGVISLVLLAIAIVAYYIGHVAGAWRWIYVVTALASLWFNVFVLVAQGFAKVPALHALAPTQAEPPFAIAQAIVFVIFVVLGVKAVRSFRPASVATS
jgi:hypothetical protein